ncbi:hypothetical protein FRB93_008816 [Tulasnella sp. JGI-2019a]|nr:hypothetical protein FRB93_008816 [Tulasnella sp. JGI-2019a]
MKSEMARKVIPCLINLTEADLAFPRDTLFISTCPLQLLNVNIYFDNRSDNRFGIMCDRDFWRWLEGQNNLRRLHLDPDVLPDLSPSALPSLDYLGASLTAARVILPNTTIRKFTEILPHTIIRRFTEILPHTIIRRFMGKEFMDYRWSREDITEVIPLMGQSLCHIEGIRISALDVDLLFQAFRQRCAQLCTINLDIYQGDNDQRVPYSEILSAAHGLSALESLHIAKHEKIDTAGLLSCTELMAKTCPMLSRIKWLARRSAPFVVHVLDLVHGQLEVSTLREQSKLQSRIESWGQASDGRGSDELYATFLF